MYDERAAILGREARAECLISATVMTCPFLSGVASRSTPAVARAMACTMDGPRGCLGGSTTGRGGPIFEEDALSALLGSFRAVHGPGGLIPLDRSVPRPPATAVAPGAPVSCVESIESIECVESFARVAPVALPMASIGLSGSFGKLPEIILRAIRNKKRHRGGRKKPRPRGSNASTSGSTTSGNTTSGSPMETSQSGQQGGKRPNGETNAERFRHMRNSLTRCPPAIVAMRAAVANLKPVRQLRPYALPVRALALAGATVSCNVPMGMLRSKTRKFSLAWVVVVHAVIPFIAALRKACLMPVWGLGLTVLGSIAGQHVGEVLERKRVKGEIKYGELCAAVARRLHPDSLVQYILT